MTHKLRDTLEQKLKYFEHNYSEHLDLWATTK